MYKWSSSINYLQNIAVPMVFINSTDDPIIPEPLLSPIKKHASKKLTLNLLFFINSVSFQWSTKIPCTLNYPMEVILDFTKAA